MAKVYAKLLPFQGMNLISEVASEFEKEVDPSWELIDEGKGSKYTNASTMYFPDGVIDEQGRYKYKFIQGVGVITLSGAELDMQNKDGGGTVTSGYPEYYIADGTGTNIILEEVKKGDLVKTGVNFTFIAVSNNNGKDTTINQVVVYKPNTKIAPSIVMGNAYDVWYDNDLKCFFVKASAGEVEGNAVPENVLADVTFSSESGIGVIGTMANNGAVVKELKGGEVVAIPKGYHNGEGRITAVKGVDGLTAKGDALTEHVLSGKQFSNDLSNELVGTMPNVGTVNAKLNPNGTYVIPRGYHDGRGSVSQSLVVRGASTITPSTQNQTIPGNVFLNAAQTILGDGNLRPENIAEGVKIFDTIGTHQSGKQVKMGSVTTTSKRMCTLDLGFEPEFIIIYTNEFSNTSREFSCVLYDNKGDYAVSCEEFMSPDDDDYAGIYDLDDSNMTITKTQFTCKAPRKNMTYLYVAVGR